MLLPNSQNVYFRSSREADPVTTRSYSLPKHYWRQVKSMKMASWAIVMGKPSTTSPKVSEPVSQQLGARWCQVHLLCQWRCPGLRENCPPMTILPMMKKFKMTKKWHVLFYNVTKITVVQISKFSTKIIISSQSYDVFGI